ncbi:putative orphan protein [Pseudoalteromonas luteoviolacea B = ATCC 29581]|nr:putative orphan protein [Pseudoalteromonas luteoviolacea B = ATCC 29581]
MGNLFLKEKENWRLWLCLGLFGAICSFLLIEQQLYANNTTELIVTALSPSFVLGVIMCWWMHYTKRFEFWRAFKVLVVIMSISSAPTVFMSILSLESKSIVWVIPVAGYIVSVVFLTCLGAFIARRPKQYY